MTHFVIKIEKATSKRVYDFYQSHTFRAYEVSLQHIPPFMTFNGTSDEGLEKVATFLQRPRWLRCLTPTKPVTKRHVEAISRVDFFGKRNPVQIVTCDVVLDFVRT